MANASAFGACAAERAGHDTWAAADAPCPEVAEFACGSLTCTALEACTMTLGPMGPEQHFCAPISPMCTFDDACDASCVGELPLGCTCALDDYGHPTITCSG